MDRRVHSDLARAAETAAALGEPTEPDRRLRELDVGAWTGLGHDEVVARYPEEVMALRRGDPVRVGGGESIEEFEARIDRFFDELCARYADQDVLAVTHGGVIRALVSRVLGARGRPNPTVGVFNTSLTIVHVDGGPPRIHTFNDTLHLDPGDRDSSILSPPAATVRLALIAACEANEPDRHLADRLSSMLGTAEAYAIGAARDTELSEQLLAEPTARSAPELAEHLLAEHEEGSFAIVLPPEELCRLVATMTRIDEGGLEPPAHGSVAQLHRAKRGALLISFGVPIGARSCLVDGAPEKSVGDVSRTP